MKPRASSRRSRTGFTLVETLISIALLAGFLVAAVSILFQISSAWASQADDPVVDRHAEGLGRFVRGVFSQSGYAGITAPTADQQSREGALLAVKPQGDLPMFNALATVGGVIEARFAISSDGALLLCWNTSGERAKSPGLSHKTLLSRWVTSAKIFVYDDTNKKWTEFTPADASSGGLGKPDALRVLRLDIERLGQRRVLEIPLPREGA